MRGEGGATGGIWSHWSRGGGGGESWGEEEGGESGEEIDRGDSDYDLNNFFVARLKEVVD